MSPATAGATRGRCRRSWSTRRRQCWWGSRTSCAWTRTRRVVGRCWPVPPTGARGWEPPTCTRCRTVAFGSRPSGRASRSGSRRRRSCPGRRNPRAARPRSRGAAAGPGRAGRRDAGRAELAPPHADAANISPVGGGGRGVRVRPGSWARRPVRRLLPQRRRGGAAGRHVALRRRLLARGDGADPAVTMASGSSGTTRRSTTSCPAVVRPSARTRPETSVSSVRESLAVTMATATRSTRWAS